MSALLVLGAGGNGRVIADIASDAGDWDRIAVLDDHQKAFEPDAHWEILGSCASLPEVASDFDALVIGFGDNTLRDEWFDRSRECGIEVATIIARSASVSSRASLGPGTVVMPQAAVNIGVSTGRCCLVNTGATIDHDCRLGDAVHVAPGAHLAGNVEVGDRTWIGIGASVRHGISIGRDVMVGAGAAVVLDLPDACSAMGVPARVRA